MMRAIRHWWFNRRHPAGTVTVTITADASKFKRQTVDVSWLVESVISAHRHRADIAYERGAARLWLTDRIARARSEVGLGGDWKPLPWPTDLMGQERDDS